MWTASRRAEFVATKLVGALLHMFEQRNVVHDRQDALRQLLVVAVEEYAIPIVQRNAGHRSRQSENRHSIEDVFENLEFEAAAAALRHNGDARPIEIRRDALHPSGELRCCGALAQSIKKRLLATADDLKLGPGGGKNGVGGVDELLKIHSLGDPVETADHHGAPRHRRSNRAPVEPPATISGRQDVDRLVGSPGAVEIAVLGRDRRYQIDGIDERPLQARHLRGIDLDSPALYAAGLIRGDRGAQRLLVIVRDVDELWPVARAQEPPLHRPQRPADRDAVEYDRMPSLAFEELCEISSHRAREAAMRQMR